MSNHSQPFGLPSSQQGANIIELLLSGWALSCEVWMRHGFGSRYVGIQGLFGALTIVGYAMLWKEVDVGPMFWFLLFFLAMVIIRRMQAFWRARNGESNHSRYSGTPTLIKRFPSYSEIKIKRWIEPLYALLVGINLCLFNVPLGSYFIIAAFMVRWNADRSEKWTRIRVREMNDAVFDHEAVAYRFRELRGDSF